MIPMNCPGCGRPGTIPPDKLNSRMHCKKCDAVFHMDANGRIVLGEPSRPGDKPKGAKVFKRAKQTKTTNPDISISNLIKSVPKPAWIVGGVAVLAFLIFQNVNFNPGPESPLGPLQTIVKAAVNGDKGSLDSLTTTATREAAQKWSDKIRATAHLTGPYAEVLAAPDLRNSSEKNDSQYYTVKFINLKDSSGQEVPLSVGVFLVMSRGHWYLDGEATLKEADKTTIIEGKTR
jgi:hypothetical protein